MNSSRTPIARLNALPSWAVQAVMGGATILVTAGIRLYGEPPDAAVLLYVPIALAACYLWSFRQALLQLTLIAVAYAAVLLGRESTWPAVGHWLLALGVMAALGAAVAKQARRMESMATRLGELERTDPVTGLLSRQGFDELFAQECERSRRSGRLLGVLVGRLDGLEREPDRLGGLAGDRMLERVAAALQHGKRRIDTAARIGGEDFAVIVPEADEYGAYIAAERLRAAVHEEFAEEPVPLEISFGVASSISHGWTQTALLEAGERGVEVARSLQGRDFALAGVELPRTIVSVSAGKARRSERLAAVLSVAKTLDLKELSAVGHSRTVGRYAAMIARELGLVGDLVTRVELAGTLHDIGKIVVPESVLRKAGPLSDEEWELIREHPQIGAGMLPGDDLDDVRGWVLAHHERPDGRGYPSGCTGREIPLGGRIVAVGAAYEAMTTKRVYRGRLSLEEAQAELSRCSGTQFDKRAVDALLRALEKQGLRQSSKHGLVAAAL